MKLRGRGIGAGSVLGTAAIVKTRNGVALMPQVPVSIAEQIAARKLIEKPDIILVAESYDAALAIVDTIEWGTVIGIASTSADNAVPAFGLPSVVEIPELLARLPDNALLLLDAERGIVSVNPDLVEIAQYQAEKENINPRHRYFLDEKDQLAQTLDGRMFRVLKWAESAEEITQSVQEGADGIFCGSNLIAALRQSEDTAQISKRLGSMVRELGGKPLIVDDDDNLPEESLVFAATQGELIVAKGLEIPSDMTALLQSLHESENFLIEKDTPSKIPLIAQLLEECHLPNLNRDEAIRDSIQESADAGASRLVMQFTGKCLFLPQEFPLLEAVATQAATLLLPLYVICHPKCVSEYDFDPDYAKTKMLEWLVGFGVSGIILLEGDSQEYKAMIRQLSYEECLHEVLSLLSPPQ